MGAGWDRLLLGPRRRRRRMERLLRQLDQVDEYGEPRRRRRTGAGHTLLVALITVVAFGVLATTVLSNGVAALIGNSARGLSAGGGGDGTYRFLRIQTGTQDVPVAYSPCRTLHVVLNPMGGPRDAERLVRSAMHEVAAASGLKLVYDGVSERRPRWSTSSLGLLGSHPPVLVAFATEQEVPQLKGDVAGVGGSSAVDTGVAGQRVLVTGQITLDSVSFAEMAVRPSGPALEQAVILHEFGHVLGLAHVHDRDELMNSHNLGL